MDADKSAKLDIESLLWDRRKPKKIKDGRGLYTKALRALAGRAEVYQLIGASLKSKADYERLLVLSSDPDRKISALTGLSALHYELGDYDRELSCARKLIRLTRKKDPLARGRALIVQAGALRDKGKYERSLDASRRAVSLLQSARKNAVLRGRRGHNIRENMSNAYKTMGMVYNMQGRYRPALACFKKSLGLITRGYDQVAIARMLNNIGLVYRQMTRYDKARINFNKGLAIAQKIGYKNGCSLILGNMGLVCHDQDDYHAALDCYRKAMSLNEELGNRSAMATNLNNSGLCYAELCDYGNALKYYKLSLDLFREIGNTMGIVFTLCNIGMIHHDRGEYIKALDYANAAGKTASRVGVQEIVIRAIILKAKVYRADKKYSKSIALIDRAVRAIDKYKIERMRLTAVEEYLITAMADKNRTRRAIMSRCVAELERVYQKAGNDSARSGLLVTLIKYYIHEKNYARAETGFKLLSSMVKNTGGKYPAALTLMVQARLYKATGRPYAGLLKEARALARELGFKFLLDEMLEIG